MDLQQMKQIATYKDCDVPISKAFWSLDSKQVLLCFNKKESKHPYVLFDTEKKVAYTLSNTNNYEFGGFTDNNTLWYKNDDFKMGTVVLSEAGGAKEITLQSDWEVRISGKLENITYDPTQKRFVMFYKDADQNYIGGLIKKGESSPAPLPKSCKKALKNAWLAKSNNTDAMLFKIRKKEEGFVLNIHTLELTAVNQMPSDINLVKGLSLTQYLEKFHDVILDQGKFKMTDRLSTYNFFGGYKRKTIEIKNGADAFSVSSDLTKVASIIECEKNMLQVAIYDYKNNTDNPVKTILPKKTYPEMDLFNEYVLSHKDAFEKHAQKLLKEDYLNNGWELVANLKPITLVGTTQVASNPTESFAIEPGYQYLAFRVDYGLIYKKEGKELPGDEQPTVLNLDANSQDDYYWSNKEVKWCCLGFTAEQYFHTSSSNLTAQISIKADESDKMMKNINSEAVRVYILRQKANGYISGSYDYESNRHVKEKIVSSTSSSSGNICKPTMDNEAALKVINIKEKEWLPEGYNAINSDKGKGAVSTSFYTPMNRSGNIFIMVITSGPCNKMDVWDISGYSLSEQVYSGRPDDFELADLPEIKNLQAKGFQVFTYKINHAAVQDKAKRYQVNIIGGSSDKTVQGVSSIHIFYK